MGGGELLKALHGFRGILPNCLRLFVRVWSFSQGLGLRVFWMFLGIWALALNVRPLGFKSSEPWELKD